MSVQYDEYIKEHVENVEKGLAWFKDNLPGIVLSCDCENVSFSDHDQSKFTPEEYDAYDKYFYGKSRSYKVVKDFNYAWLHHIHNNPHHWQHWVLINDEPYEMENASLPMPNCYILEMICDWWAFSWKKGDLSEIFKWYDEHKDYIIMHHSTRGIVNYILYEMKKKLEVKNAGE